MRKSSTRFRRLHLETFNELTGVDHAMEVEHRSLVEKSLLEEINNIKKNTLVDELNGTTTEMTGMKPKDVIKLNEVPLVN